MSRAILLVLVTACAIFALGCSSLLAPSVQAVNASHDALVKTHDQLDAMERSDRDKALASATDEATARAATDAVIKAYSQRWDVYDDARAAWFTAHAAVTAGTLLEASGGKPDLPFILGTLTALSKAWSEIAKLTGAPALISQ